MSAHDFDEGAVAVIGLAARLPGAPDIDAFWRVLARGEDTITWFTNDELLDAGLDDDEVSDPAYVPAKGLLPHADCFDAGYFGLSPADAALMDPQQRVFVECAKTALDHAGYGAAPDRVVGVFGGSILSMYLLSHLWPNSEVMQRSGTFQVAVGNDPTFLATRVSYLLDLKGPSVSVGTACSTGLVAVHQACQSLLSMECDMALAGAVSIHLPLVSGYRYAQGSILSPTGECRPFDQDAAGTVSSDGAGVVALKRLAEALADGDTVHAVIRGSAINNDGHDKVGFTAPAVAAQSRVIAEAQEIAGTPPASIAMIEAHAAGTHLGDPIEVAALREVFAGHGAHCAIGSVKSNIGHVDAAAGIAGFIKAVLAVSHRAIPASVHVETPNPALRLAQSGFYIPRSLTPHDDTMGPMRAGVSSFGIGGSNCHVVLEQPPDSQPAAPGHPAELLQLSAKTEPALRELAGGLADHLEHTDRPLAEVAHTLRIGRAQHLHRLSVVAATATQGAEALRNAASVEATLPPVAQRDVAFMFPGLGDHYGAMGWELYCLERPFRAEIDACANLLAGHLDGDIRDVLFDGKNWREAGPDLLDYSMGLDHSTGPKKLDLRAMLGRDSTESPKEPAAIDFPRGGQPAIFVLEYSLARALQHWGFEPKALVGYSVGEFVAACLSGIFSLADALHIVAARAKLIETHVARGGMLAVPMGEAELTPRLPDTLSLSAANGPRLCVVAGPPAELSAFQAQLALENCTCQALDATYAYHSKMMDRIVPELAAIVGSVTLNAPQIPCVSCVTGDWLSAAQTTDPQYWARHLARTIRFRDAIGTLLYEGDFALAELGPGQSLCAHAKAVQAHTAGPPTVMAPLMKWAYSKASEWYTLLSGLGQLWCGGVQASGARLLAREGLRRVPLPPYPFARERHWVASSAPGERAPAGRKDFEDWALVPHWRPAPTVPRELPANRSWLVFDDGSALCDTLVESLIRAGATAARVRRGLRTNIDAESLILAPDEPTAMESLIAALAATRGLPNHILYLWSAQPAGDFAAGQEQGFFALQSLCAALIRNGSFDEVTVHALARGLSAVAAERPNPDQTPLLGALRVAAQERPGLITSAIDPGTDDLEATAAAVLHELAQPVTAPVVAYRYGQRWIEDYASTPLPKMSASCSVPRRDDVYVITGGLGGVGMAMASFLARQCPVKLALLGRTALPPDADCLNVRQGTQDAIGQRLAQVQALRAAGAQVMTAAVDVADANAMERVFSEIEQQLGPISGVFHCAGAIGAETFAEIARATRSEAQGQFHAKVHGTQVLEAVLKNRQAKFCVLMSSLAAVLGGLGFSAYAAANLYMDAFAQARTGQPGTRWLSINWDAWRISAVKSALDGFGETVSEYYMEPDEGAAACLHLLALPTVARAVISTGDLNARLRQWVGGTTQPQSLMTRQQRGAMPQSFSPPETDTQQRLTEIWQDLFALDPIGIHDNFFELGGHSLLATQMNARIASRIGVELSLTDVLAAPSVAELATVVDDARLAAVAPEDLADMLADLDGLNSAEITALLEQDNN